MLEIFKIQTAEVCVNNERTIDFGVCLCVDGNSDKRNNEDNLR